MRSGRAQTGAINLGVWITIFSGLFCGLGVLVGAAYLYYSRPGRQRGGVWSLESDFAFRQRLRRRRLGAALLIAVSMAFLAGTAWLRPASAPLAYLLYWMIVLIMLGWLVVLGLADLLQTRTMLRRHLDERRSRERSE